MKVFTVISIVAALACGAGCGKKDDGEKPAQKVNTDVLIRCHFVGTASLIHNTNAARARELWTLPESRRLVDQTLQKLAHAPRTLCGDRVTAAQATRFLCDPLTGQHIVRAETRFSSHTRDSVTDETRISSHAQRVDPRDEILVSCDQEILVGANPAWPKLSPAARSEPCDGVGNRTGDEPA